MEHGRRTDEPTGRAGQEAAASRAPAEAPASGSPRPAAATSRPSGRLRWWEQDPARYEREVRELSEAGYDPRPQEAAGRIRVAINVPCDGRSVPMEIRFPDLFPFFRFEVYAPELRLARHQNPLAGNLCLLPQPTREWLPSMTAAWLIRTQLPKLLDAARAEGVAPQLETHQPEPTSAYYGTLGESVIVMPPEAYNLPADRMRGRLELSLASLPEPIRGFVRKIDARQGSFPDLSVALPTREVIDVPWVRVTDLPRTTHAPAFARALLDAGLIMPARANGKLDIVGITFPEDVAYGAPAENGWLFLVRIRGSRQAGVALVATQRYDPREQALRLRDVAGLAEKTIVQFGAGGLGGPLGHLLMQSRVRRLVIVDPDGVEIGQTVRWPLGFAAVGISKVMALARFAKANYPQTQVVPIPWRVGASYDEDTPDEGESLERALEDADLVIDTTAELGVQQFLAAECRDRGLTYILVEAREGAYAGLVARLRKEGACWMCLKYHMDDGRFVLPYDRYTGSVQPRGCSSPTFTGAAFDLVPIAALAARLAAQTLVASEAYPDADWDLAVLLNRREDGSADGMPRWEHHRLEIHPRCPLHA